MNKLQRTSLNHIPEGWKSQQIFMHFFFHGVDVVAHLVMVGSSLCFCKYLYLWFSFQMQSLLFSICSVILKYDI